MTSNIEHICILITYCVHNLCIPAHIFPLSVNLLEDNLAQAFMAKNLTLIPHQGKELESDLIQESFLKDHEKDLAYKQAFDFKNRMF